MLRVGHLPATQRTRDIESNGELAGFKVVPPADPEIMRFTEAELVILAEGGRKHSTDLRHGQQHFRLRCQPERDLPVAGRGCAVSVTTDQNRRGRGEATCGLKNEQYF